MLLSVGKLRADAVEVVVVGNGQEVVLEGMVVGLDESWRTMAVEEWAEGEEGAVVCRVMLQERGAEYRLRVASQEDWVSVVSAPPAPEVVGVGRNVCVLAATCRWPELAVEWLGNGERGSTTLKETRPGHWAAFPKLHSDAAYVFWLRPVAECPAATSEAVEWTTLVAAPEIRAWTGAEVVLALPEARCLVECRVDDGPWTRLCATEGGTLRASRMPTDSRCSLRARCCRDLRSEGAPTHFWDTSAVVAVETAPAPPRFRGDGSSLRVTWTSRSTCVLRAYDSSSASFRTVYKGKKTEVEVKLGLAVGACACFELLRVGDRGEESAAATFCALVGPEPPTVAWSDEAKTRVNVSWEGALDLSRVPADRRNGAIPEKYALEVVASPLLAAVRRSPRQQECFRAVAESKGGARVVLSLSPGLRYRFRLKAVFGTGFATSDCVEVVRKPEPPAKPEPPEPDVDFFVSVDGRRSPVVRLTWRPPAVRGATVDAYLVQVRRRSQWRDLYEGPQVTCCDEASLHAEGPISAMYRVKARSCLGWSAFSEPAHLDAPDGLGGWRPQPARATLPVAAAVTVDECYSLVAEGEPRAPTATGDSLVRECPWPPACRAKRHSSAQATLLAQVESMVSYPVSRAVLAAALGEYLSNRDMGVA